MSPLILFLGALGLPTQSVAEVLSRDLVESHRMLELACIHYGWCGKWYYGQICEMVRSKRTGFRIRLLPPL